MTKPKGKHKSGGRALVICNGDVLPRKELLPLVWTTSLIVCADGGANKARKLGITPDLIIGDLDSITPSTRKFYSTVKTIRVTSQENTDLEKALDVLVGKGIRSAVIVGAMGGRPDHAYANFSIFKKYYKLLDLVFSDALCDIRIIEGKNILDLPVGSILSLMPFGRCDGITARGLEFPLVNDSLEMGVREGASNRVCASPVSIEIKKGCLLLFLVKHL